MQFSTCIVSVQLCTFLYIIKLDHFHVVRSRFNRDIITRQARTYFVFACLVLVKDNVTDNVRGFSEFLICFPECLLIHDRIFYFKFDSLFDLGGFNRSQVICITSDNYILYIIRLFDRSSRYPSSSLCSPSPSCPTPRSRTCKPPESDKSGRRRRRTL